MNCEICKENLAQYKCPACGFMTCSVKCVKKHKENNSCSGKVPNSNFIPLNNMNEHHLMKDCEFLDKISLSLIHSNEKIPEKSNLKKWKKKLILSCKDRGITLHFMPNNSTRSQNNKTKLSKDGNIIYWTILWRFFINFDIIEFETYSNLIH